MAGETTIKRTHQRNDPFARVPKDRLEYSVLSWKAKGILAYLLGKPKDWKIRVTDLERRGRDGVSAVRSALKEIRAHGYGLLQAEKEEGRVVAWTFLLADLPVYYSDPANIKLRQKLGIPDIDFPHLENPHVEKPDVENQYLTENDSLPRLNGTKINGRRPLLLNKVQKKRKKKRAPRGGADAPAAPAGADSSSSFVSVETRGSAPAGGCATSPKIGEAYPASLLHENDQKSLPGENTSDEDLAEAFLWLWRSCQKQILNRYPRLTEEDRNLVLAFIDEIRDNYRSILAMAITSWDLRQVKEPNGYEKRQTARLHGKKLKSFLNNLERIEQELDWNHFKVDQHTDLIRQVVKGE